MTTFVGILAVAAAFAVFGWFRIADRRPHRCDGCICSGGRCLLEHETQSITSESRHEDD